VDFLLECVGIPPDYDLEALARRVQHAGEPVAWRGDPELHRRLDLGDGLELRVDREESGSPWTILPYYRSPHRLRVAVSAVRRVPDSPFDALLLGWAAPPVAPAVARPGDPPGAYALSMFLTDARRLPRRVPPGHVLAVNASGFALDVSYVGPNPGVRDPAILERRRGASIEPLGGLDDPGGCAEISARIRALRHLRNPITGREVDLLEVDAPERPLLLFLSRWQLREDDLPLPRPGWRIEGTFLLTGRIAGGLPGPRRKVPKAFG
jgi:hypothetical protein